MTKKKSRNKSKDRKSLEELIVKSHDIRKKIDKIMVAYKKIEKHMAEMQKSVSERRVRQQSMNHRLEQLMKNMKELGESIKPKND